MNSKIQKDDFEVSRLPDEVYRCAEAFEKNYTQRVSSEVYYYLLNIFRHHIKRQSDYYFSEIVNAKNIDLYMITNSVSSPFGPGSDSQPIPLEFGGQHCYLVDSSQFGFEPVVMNRIPRAYCYLPSFRNEDPDHRHLNQFFHCEYEAQENFETTLEIAEGYFKSLVSISQLLPNVMKRLSSNINETNEFLNETLTVKHFPKISFDEAEATLIKHGHSKEIVSLESGKIISHVGEALLMKILEAKTPVWLTGHHRDTVPFYQKPNPHSLDRTLTADLLVPQLTATSFCGEVLGLGQRQDSIFEMLESLERQKLSGEAYEWYIDLRKQKNYKTTSGFGLGIERYISWILGFDNISNAILYPRIKGSKLYP